MAKFGVVLAALMLSGCSTLGHNMMCFGTGACSDGPVSSTRFTAAPSLNMPSSIQLGTANYLVVPNYSTGGVSAIIQTAK